MRIASVLVPLFVAACARPEPPPFVTEANDGAILPVSAPGAAGSVAPAPGVTGATMDADAASSPDMATDAGDEDGGVDPGTLPQTHERPRADDPALLRDAARFVEAVAHDDPPRARPFFFPVSAYEQVKDVGNPARDWKYRLMAAFEHDIHELHAQLGARAAKLRFTRIDIVEARARWVEPGEEYNRLGYFRVFGSEVVADAGGSAVKIPIKSLISWRGRWYCVHLARVK